ncbi:hypothetical protein PGRAN_00750 [Listeria grandensis FSL F6-0971]|uniref:Gram-positive cocci surface proteins LPxTG domain-containing protein n=1 Tax=Listeria grandensis FSL F6-0971 TaxID=1265819 RepID=W7BBA6_9LIST|nr:LPXTG cell wall anchor domain-containing protein [Listeria grandensis]EUJ24404.1 hypothetical protein PGRAN_00750 [Listeria grandensis FSL F6-0971]
MKRQRNSSMCRGLLFVVVVSLGISGHQYVEATTGKSELNIRIVENELEVVEEAPVDEVGLPHTGDNNSVFSLIIGGILILLSLVYMRKRKIRE